MIKTVPDVGRQSADKDSQSAGVTAPSPLVWSAFSSAAGLNRENNELLEIVSIPPDSTERSESTDLRRSQLTASAARKC